MSRTHKTKPTKFQIAEGKSWSDITFNSPPDYKKGRKEYWGAQRTAERNALNGGRTPEPSRTRHSVRWDLF